MVAVGLGVVPSPAQPMPASASALDPVGFGKSTLAGTASTYPTSLQFGPDGRLYVGQLDGVIYAYTVVRNGPNDYAVTATEKISKIKKIPNHDDNGALNPNLKTRALTGMLVTGTPSKPVIYATSSDPRLTGGPYYVNKSIDTNSSMVSKVVWKQTKWKRVDLVRGLPRAYVEHMANGLALDSSTNTLYVAQGGNSNMGAKGGLFGHLPEYAYSAAILKIDLTAIGNQTYDLPTLVDEQLPGLTGPFGGDRGRHQARIVPSSPVQVYAPGFRNPYDLLLTPTGKLYTIDNGPNAGAGDVPVGEGPEGTCTNAKHEPGTTYRDSLHLVTGPGYYGGHPNPTRGNRANTFNRTNPQSPVPVANPIECDARPAGENGALAVLPSSGDGFTQYLATNFGGEMTGDLIVANFARS
jgi:glucose/arabinose dehydrogenase